VIWVERAEYADIDVTSTVGQFETECLYSRSIVCMKGHYIAILFRVVILTCLIYIDRSSPSYSISGRVSISIVVLSVALG